MSLDIEKEIARHQKGWADFAKMITIGSISVVALLAILAITVA
jgi:hypothetical protein